MIFTGMSFKVLALSFRSFLIVFMISVSLNSRKVNISLLKCFLIFLVECILKCLENVLEVSFFRVVDVFLNLRVFAKFVKYFCSKYVNIYSM